MPLERFLDGMDSPDRELVLVNRSAPEPVKAMVTDLFADQPVDVSEDEISGADEDMVYLFEQGELRASSPLQELLDGILLVNSDMFVTGSGAFEDVAVPDVIDELSETRFSLRGYPESNSEKLILILLSRFIERFAFEAGAGTLRVALQRLSRLQDEQGTMTVYEHLAGTDVDVHLYGVPDWLPPRELDVIVHGGYGSAFTDSWFVLFEPETPADRSAGLVAHQTEPRTWDGFYTYDEGRVTEVLEHVESTL